MKDSLLTRRSWAVLVAAVPIAAQVATTPSSLAPPATAVPPASSPADDVRKASELLAQIEIPMSLEPAFAFHV